MSSPTPALTANLNGMGMASKSRWRSGDRLSIRNSSPERKQRARASFREYPQRWARVWVK